MGHDHSGRGTPGEAHGPGRTPAVCVTLDLEADYAGMTGGDCHASLDRTADFERLVRDSGVRLTTFVTGFILDNDFPVLSRLKALGSRFETHTYSHPLARPAAEKIPDIRRGIEAYARYFGARPRGYRAPQGLISMEEVQALAGEGIAYSSSIFPAWLPGRYNNLRFPTGPFVYREAGLLEIPMAVIPRIRVPVTASHVNLLGWPLYRLLFAAFGYPPLLNICTHLYDFADVDSYARLPMKEKIGYSRMRRMGDKTRGFAALLRHLASRGYRFAYLGDVAAEITRADGAPRWSPRTTLTR